MFHLKVASRENVDLYFHVTVISLGVSVPLYLFIIKTETASLPLSSREHAYIILTPLNPTFIY